MKITAKWFAPKLREIDLTGCFEIQIGDGREALGIFITEEGRIVVRAIRGQLLVRPTTANVIEITQEGL